MIDPSKKETRVVVAMSGGVDSSVVAAMLVEQGYQVIGVTMQLYDHGMAIAKKGACCAGQDIYDAKMVADKLSIPHYVLNYESQFKEEVIDDFVDSYLNGYTPIPCIKCNQTVKFRDLIKMAKELGADFMATGHYVRRVENDGKVEMHRGMDTSKDQSYFLFGTTQEQLEYLRFPLGHLNKEETRILAQKYGLAVAEKADSQDICFVPEGKYGDLVKKLRPSSIEVGEVVNMEGEVLGYHSGISNFTIGQRKGLGISGVDPLYVIKINPANNQVVVGGNDNLNKSRFIIKDINWLDGEFKGEFEVGVKIRSSQKIVKAKVFAMQKQQAEVLLGEFSRAITPGQACVIYKNDRVLGGGWITQEIN
jgi:tRNA-uridine 2-sulfurtransferase